MGFLPHKLVVRLSQNKDLPPLKRTSFRIGEIPAKQPLKFLLKLAGPLLDRLFGTYPLHVMYHRYKLWKYNGIEFLRHFLPATGVTYYCKGKGLDVLPKTGKTIIIGNHPHGGIEGVILAYMLNRRRTDYKLFVNIMLYFVKELAEFFIFTNPMLPGSKSNARAIRKAEEWIKNNHCLVVFPAGRVGLYRESRGYITDESWDRMAVSLTLHTDTPIYPIFIDGHCSALFSWSCRILFPMKLLMLVNEFLKSFSRTIKFYTGNPISPEEIRHMTRIRANAYLRMRTYLLAPLSLDGLGKAADKNSNQIRLSMSKSPRIYGTPSRAVKSDSAAHYFNMSNIKRIAGTNSVIELSPINFWEYETSSIIYTEQHHNSVFIFLLTFSSLYPESAVSQKTNHFTALWLYSFLQSKKQRKTKIKKRALLHPSPITTALRPLSLQLHREVFWFFSRYTLNPTEANTVITAIEEKNLDINARVQKFEHCIALGLSEDEFQNPVLLLCSSKHKIIHQ